MSIKHLNAARACRKFRGNTRLLLFVLCDRASDGKHSLLPFGYCNPSITQLVEDMNASGRRIVTQSMAELIEERVVERERKWNSASRTQVKLSRLQELALPSGDSSLVAGCNSSLPSGDSSPGSGDSGPSGSGDSGPLTVTEPKSKPKVKAVSCLSKRETQISLNSTSTSKATADPIDPRHAPVRELIQKLHQEHFGVSCPWTGREGKRFGRFLQSVPDWSLETLQRTIANYFASPGISAGVPRFDKLACYVNAPLDAFGHETETRATAEMRSWFRRRTDKQAEAELASVEQ
jgi:hypothetical protein